MTLPLAALGLVLLASRAWGWEDPVLAATWLLALLAGGLHLYRRMSR